jgi:hypothetical protein
MTSREAFDTPLCDAFVVITPAGQTFLGEEWPQAFADYFQEKVKTIANETSIPESPDYGVNKVTMEK